jgi:uncharacterized protein (DUF427 family)
MPYFPLDSVHFERLEPSSTTTWCFWKGKATYSHVRGMRRVAIDAAFMYRRPWPLARRLVGCRIAFWRDVEIVDE